MKHCRIVERSLNGKRSVDDKTFASVAVLSERLERLQKADERFCEIELSNHVKSLKNRRKEPVSLLNGFSD
ncbi:MAG: hypothetical protein ACYTFE_05205 [Planctomycetota bacterium]|jgi:hypothetical protein